jgi:hypothetical protein
MGRWDEALVEAETGVEIAGEVGTRLAIVVCAAVAAWIRAHRDDLAEAEQLLAIAQSEIDRAGPQWGSYWVILSTAQLADGRDDPPRALEALYDGWTANEHSLGLRTYLAPELVRAALGAGNTELARSVADTVASYAPGANASSARGNALLARGLVDHDPELLAQATAAFRSGGSPHDVAIACEATATAIAAHGDTLAGGPLFEEALQTYERLSARRDIGRVLAAMRAAGMTSASVTVALLSAGSDRRSMRGGQMRSGSSSSPLGVAAVGRRCAAPRRAGCHRGGLRSRTGAWVRCGRSGPAALWEGGPG